MQSDISAEGIRNMQEGSEDVNMEGTEAAIDVSMTMLEAVDATNELYGKMLAEEHKRKNSETLADESLPDAEEKTELSLGRAGMEKRAEFYGQEQWQQR